MTPLIVSKSCQLANPRISPNVYQIPASCSAHPNLISRVQASLENCIKRISSWLTKLTSCPSRLPHSHSDSSRTKNQAKVWSNLLKFSSSARPSPNLNHSCFKSQSKVVPIHCTQLLKFEKATQELHQSHHRVVSRLSSYHTVKFVSYCLTPKSWKLDHSITNQIKSKVNPNQDQVHQERRIDYTNSNLQECWIERRIKFTKSAESNLHLHQI